MTEARQSRRVDIHVGYDPTVTKNRVLDALRRAGSNDPVPDTHLTFESWHGLARALSDDRLALLHHLHRHPGTTIDVLSHALDRAPKETQNDVEALMAAGLVDRDEAGGFSTPFDEIRALITL